MNNKTTQTLDICTVFRQLSVPAQDILLRRFSTDGGLSRIRMVCKEFRNFVDSGVETFTLALAPQHKLLVEAGHGPPTLPRCRGLNRRLKIKTGWDTGTTASVLRLAVRAMPHSMRTRITSLTVMVEEQMCAGLQVAISAVLTCLPALRTVDLCSDLFWPRPPSQEKLMYDKLLYDTLATLPCLESLYAPCLSFVSHFAAVTAAPGSCRGEGAGSSSSSNGCGDSDGSPKLKSLAITGGTLTPSIVGDLSRLIHLVKLDVSNCMDSDGTAPLLDNLPPRLEELTLQEATLTLSSGTIEEVEVDTFHVQNVDCAWVRQLLSSKAMGRRVSRMTFRHLSVGEQRPQPSGPLRELLSRCERVEVDILYIYSFATERSVYDTLELLGCWPRRCEIGINYRLEIRRICALDLPWAGAPFRPGGDGPMPPVALPPLRPPAPCRAAPHHPSQPGQPQQQQQRQQQRQQPGGPVDGEAGSPMPEADAEEVGVRGVQGGSESQRGNGGGNGGQPQEDLEEELEGEKAEEEELEAFVTSLVGHFIQTRCLIPDAPRVLQSVIAGGGGGGSGGRRASSLMLLRGQRVSRLLSAPAEELDAWLQRLFDFINSDNFYRLCADYVTEGSMDQALEVFYLTLPTHQAVMLCFEASSHTHAFAAAAMVTEGLTPTSNVVVLTAPALVDPTASLQMVMLPDDFFGGNRRLDTCEVLSGIMTPVLERMWRQYCREVREGAAAASGSNTDAGSALGHGAGVDSRLAVAHLCRLTQLGDRMRLWLEEEKCLV